jgi:hypothetical protein
MEGGWVSNIPTGSYGVGLWKFIRHGWDKFSGLLKFEVGDGTRIRFWDDVWCMDGTLKVAFPELYRIARAPVAFVGDNFQYQGVSFHWDVTFSRLAQDWELESFASFLELLYSTKVKGIGADTVWWQP